MELTISNPKIDTTPLPDDQPVHLLEEARDHYVGLDPPFVTRNGGRTLNGTAKHVVLATPDGKYPQLPVVVKCIHRLWSKSLTYATVDLNGKRRIVKSRSGGPNGGASYICKSGLSSHSSYLRIQSRPACFLFRCSIFGSNADLNDSVERCRQRLC